MTSSLLLPTNDNPQTRSSCCALVRKIACTPSTFGQGLRRKNERCAAFEAALQPAQTSPEARTTRRRSRSQCADSRRDPRGLATTLAAQNALVTLQNTESLSNQLGLQLKALSQFWSKLAEVGLKSVEVEPKSADSRGPSGPSRSASEPSLVEIGGRVRTKAGQAFDRVRPNSPKQCPSSAKCRRCRHRWARFRRHRPASPEFG